MLLAVALLGTGGCVIARSKYLAVTAASAATLLVVDAWFDVTTSPSGAGFFWALVMAAVAELPARGGLRLAGLPHRAPVPGRAHPVPGAHEALELTAAPARVTVGE